MAGLGHIAVGLAAGRLYAAGAPRREKARAMAAFAAIAMLPDLDVIGFKFGVRYESPFGHRGAWHSMAVAITGALLIAFLVWAFGGLFRRTAIFATATLLSHGLLDTMTDGGQGVALFWPWTTARYFAAWRPIPVAPIGKGMLSERGLHVTEVELVLFLPFLVFAFWPVWLTPGRGRAKPSA